MTDSKRSEANPRRLYRDTERGMFFGVCAGIADYFGFRTGAVRLLTVIGGIFFMPATVFFYLSAALLLRPKPQGMYKTADEESFWRTVRRDPHNTLREVRAKFRSLDERLQRMERYVTSPRFDLDREFDNLKD
jgi:phage shock protein C